MIKKFNLRASFRNISGTRVCKCWIGKVIDREDIDRVWVVLRGPNIDSMSNKWSGKVGQDKSVC